MSLIQFLRILAARKAVIFATLLACFFAATVTVFLLPPRYEASNRVRIDITKPDPLTGQMSQQMMSAYLGTQLKMITDVQTAGLVVDSLGWAVDPANQAAFEAAGRPGGDIRDWLAQQIVANTEAKFDSGNIISITYRGTDPAGTQGIAQAIREAFLKLNREQRANTAQRSAATYQEQAQRALVAVQAGEQARTQFAKDNGIVYQPGSTDLESAKLSALSNASTLPTPGQVVSGQQVDPRVEMLKQQIAQAEQTLGPNHPTLQALKRQLSVAESTGGSRGGTVIGGTSRAQIESAYQAQKARVMGQADKMDRLSQMDADVAVKRDQYQKLASKAEEMKSIAQAGDTNIEPMGNTNLPGAPVWPNKPAVIGGAIGLGLVLGILLALMVELFARRVRSEDDLEYATGAPVLAVVGQPRPENSMSSRMLRLIDRNRANQSNALAEA